MIETGARSVIGLMRPGTAALPTPSFFPPRAGARAFLPAPGRSKIRRRVYVIEAGARSVVGLMRPGTAALPAPLRFPARAGVRRLFAAPGRSKIGRRVCMIETGARSVIGSMRPGTAALLRTVKSPMIQDGIGRLRSTLLNGAAGPLPTGPHQGQS
ncbi:MAG: hypothetical protein GX456_00190 [Verrucomicrobia bacterium]|nr:hypothetical protein [Verrucomicrobiota bacterium]